MRLGAHTQIARREQLERHIFKTFFEGRGLRVMRGPFEGLSYPSARSVGSVLYPKLVGTYEEELHEALESLIAHVPQVVIDIGAAEGYYANGLARRLPNARIVAFEATEHGQQLCLQMAQHNAVASQVDVRGSCDRAALESLAQEHQRGFILCDCEGYELELLFDMPTLAGFDMIVELHDLEAQGPTISQRFQDEFRDTHEVTIINARHRRSVEHLSSLGVSPDALQAVLGEDRRYSIGWALLLSKAA